MKMLKGAALISLTIALSACQEAPPEVSDQQLLELLSGTWAFGTDPDYPTIAKRTEECVRLLSGLDDEIYQDMPEEMLGAFKTDCRADLNERVNDPERNAAGLELKHFEIPALAERVTAVRADADEKERAAREAERLQREAERKLEEEKRAAERKLQEEKRAAEISQEIKEARTRIDAVVASLDERLATINARCQEFRDLKAQVVEKNRASLYRNLGNPYICRENTQQQMINSAQKAAVDIAELEANPPTGRFSLPSLRQADPEFLDQQFAKMDSDMAGMRAELTQ